MISVATDVWLAFMERRPVAGILVSLLEEHAVEVHQFVLAELELGTSTRATQLLEDLVKLVGPEPQTHADVLAFARNYGLGKSGISYVEAHLLCNAHAHGHLLWSLDDEVVEIAKRIGIAFPRPD